MAGIQCGRGVLVLTVLLGICSLALGESPEVSPPGPEKSASGYIKVNETEDAHLFYWLFYPREPEHSLGTIIWLSGGPGASSMVGLFGENGPYYINKEGELAQRQYSWNQRTTSIFVDSPVGTGFSYSSELRKDIAHDEDTVARDLANFLKELLVKYPNLDRDLYITGESYAGHYEPALAHKLLSFETGFDLKGVLLGNPLIAPKAHYKAYSEFAYDNGLISRFTKRAMDAAFENTCAPAIDKCHEQSSENGTASATAACTAALDVCEAECFVPVSAEAPLHTKHSFNPYDISTPCENGSLCYDFSAIGSFLNKETVKEQLGVSGHDWQEVSQRVHVALSTTDWMQNLEVVMPEILENLPILLYDGTSDFICNWLSNYRVCENLQWPGLQNFTDQEWTSWKLSDGTYAGEFKYASNFTFLKVYGAGHLVPMDQPRSALEMLHIFLSGGSFASEE